MKPNTHVHAVADGAVLRVTIDRPEERNPLSRALFDLGNGAFHAIRTFPVPVVAALNGSPSAEAPSSPSRATSASPRATRASASCRER